MSKMFHNLPATVDKISAVAGSRCSPQTSFDRLSNSPGMDNSGLTCTVIDALRVDYTNGAGIAVVKVDPTGLGTCLTSTARARRKPCASAHGTASAHSRYVRNLDFVSNVATGDRPRRNHPNFGCLEHGQLGVLTSLVRPPSVRVGLSADTLL